MNGNKDTTHQNLTDAANAGLGGKFIAGNAQINKAERSQINNLSFPLRHRKKKSQLHWKKEGNHKDQSEDYENGEKKDSIGNQ